VAVARALLAGEAEARGELAARAGLEAAPAAGLPEAGALSSERFD
jgi:hypothetical protein